MYILASEIFSQMRSGTIKAPEIGARFPESICSASF